MCIDICPVGALTSGTYRYHTRPWEMEHVGTICTHCSNGCKTTLGVRNDEIIRGNNRDRSGINGEFLCIKGRYAFDFYKHPERLLAPLVRVNGKLEEVSWAKALETVAAKFNEVRARNGKFGIVGSNHTTNEENYYLQKFGRKVLGTGNIDHHRTGDVITLLDALSGKQGKLATTADLYQKKAVLVIGADLALEQPFLSFQIRANWRHHQAHVYVVTAAPVREDKYAAASLRVAPGGEMDGVQSLAERLKAEADLVIVFGDAIKGEAVARLVDFGESLGIPVQYICLVDDSNSRGAVDMGLLPDAGGMALPEMLAAGDLDVLWVVGANPVKTQALPAGRASMLVVHDLFLTETAQAADVVFPAASLYEKNGTVTNVCGEVQRLRRAIRTMGAKPDLEIMGLLAREMGVAAELGPWVPDTVFEEIRRNVRGYDVALPVLEAGGAAQTAALNGRLPLDGRPELIRSAHENLFTSGTLGRYSKILNSVVESHGNR
jgi:NADH-quinone oxidoreductase subunit G